MDIKATLEECLYAWKEVQKALKNMHITTTSRKTGKETFGAYFYLHALSEQEIQALEYDLKQLEGENK